MPRRLERLLQIDQFIRSRERHTAMSIADELKFSERTVRSDLAMLKDRYDAPIESTPSKGLYYTDPDWRLPSVPITQGELMALTLGVRLLESCTGSVYQEELRGAIGRLADRLPEQLWVDLQRLAEENVVFRAGAELNLDPQVWRVLEEACAGRRRVRMFYSTPGREGVLERELDPYVLHFSRNNPYVTGWCHKNLAVRDFRVDRIRSILLLKVGFEMDPGFDRRAHFARMFMHEAGGEPRSIEIWFDAKAAPYIRERCWHPTQSLEEDGAGGVTLRMEVPGLNEVKRWVLFYGAGARVLGPPELVEMMRAEVDGMRQFYQEDGE
jgi:predicted DNA-binding transcriptional regulator YafY